MKDHDEKVKLAKITFNRSRKSLASLSAVLLTDQICSFPSQLVFDSSTYTSLRVPRVSLCSFSGSYQLSSCVLSFSSPSQGKIDWRKFLRLFAYTQDRSRFWRRNRERKCLPSIRLDQTLRLRWFACIEICSKGGKRGFDRCYSASYSIIFNNRD